MTLRNGQPYWRWLCIPDWPSFQISLTESGTLAIERALPLQQREIRRCFGAVLTSEQLNCLIEIAEAISTHLKDQPAH